MKTPILLLSALILAACSQSPALAQKGKRPGVDASRYGWLFGMTEGKQQAKKTGKPMMVVLRCQP